MMLTQINTIPIIGQIANMRGWEIIFILAFLLISLAILIGLAVGIPYYIRWLKKS